MKLQNSPKSSSNFITTKAFAKSLIGLADCGDPGFSGRKSGLLSPFAPTRTLGFFRSAQYLEQKRVQGQVPGAGS